MLRSLALQLFLLLLLAFASGYQLPSFEDADWRTVIFLAPSGMIGNFLSHDPIMRSFYDDISPGRLGDGARPEFMGLLFAAMVLNGVLIFRRVRRRPETI